MILLIVLIVGLLLFSPIKQAIWKVKQYGFTPGVLFFAILLLFYIVIPIIYVLIPEYRDDTTLFNILLGKNSDSSIAMAVMMMSILILLYYFSYIRGKSNYDSSILIDWNSANDACSRKIERIADVCFVLGALSVGICMQAVGGFMSYLAFGVNMRGIDKDMTMTIDSALLPLITLSTVVLVSPYLYYMLVHKDSKGSIKHKIKFWASFFLATIYLLYNQGRLPLLLFFVPFLLDMKVFKRMSLWSLLLITIGSVFLLSIMDSLFIYLSFGYWDSGSDSSFLNTLLLEFTYPFSNFINRDTLVDKIGFRYGYDYIVWILLLIPASLLSPLGIVKKNITTMGLLNTEAYSSVLNQIAGGGIPTDFFTFNYYQFGYFSLIIATIIAGKLLSKLDGIVTQIRNNPMTSIITLRISFLLISLVNNFDFSVIFRMRFDLLILIYVLYYINKMGKNYYTTLI